MKLRVLEIIRTTRMEYNDTGGTSHQVGIRIVHRVFYLGRGAKQETQSVFGEIPSNIAG
jgi:hypothetical protein